MKTAKKAAPPRTDVLVHPGTSIFVYRDQGANIAQPRYIWPPRLLMFSTPHSPTPVNPRGAERFQPGRVFTPPEIEVTQ
jgi:hypothetical protein